MAVFSFHPVKAITTGEGGMILTDRDDLAARLRQLRRHGTTREPAELERPDEGPWYYEMQALGFNYRLPDLNQRFGFAPGDFLAAELHYQQALSIPLYPAMSDEDADRVIAALRQVVR